MSGSLVFFFSSGQSSVNVMFIVLYDLCFRLLEVVLTSANIEFSKYSVCGSEVFSSFLKEARLGFLLLVM